MPRAADHSLRNIFVISLVLGMFVSIGGGMITQSSLRGQATSTTVNTGSINAVHQAATRAGWVRMASGEARVQQEGAAAPCGADEMCVTPNIQTGEAAWFNDGTNFSAGCYAIEYVGGCRREVGGHEQYLINRGAADRYAIVQRGEDAQAESVIGRAPGTSSLWNTQAECEGANASQRLSFNHPGGGIGVQLIQGEDTGNAYQNGSRNPTFRIVTSQCRSCFICQHQHFSACDAGTVTSCSSIVAGEHEGQCEWRTPAGETTPRCVTWFQPYCERRLAAATEDWKIMIPGTTLAPNAFPPDCTSQNYYYEGHASEARCSPFFDMVQACIDTSQLNISGPANLLFNHDSCSLFSNEAQVMARGREIQRTLGNGYTVTVIGHRLPFTDTCQTPMRLVITRTAITVQYGTCHADGSRCTERNRSISCTDAGVVRLESCCRRDLDSGVNTWTARDSCPETRCGNIVDRQCRTLSPTVDCTERGGRPETYSCCASTGDEEIGWGTWTPGNSCAPIQCHTLGNRACTNRFVGIRCRDATGIQRNEVCCPKYWSRTVDEWVRGTVCPPRIIEGQCEGTSDNRYVERWGTDDASSRLEACMARESERCHREEGRRLRRETCTTSTTNGGIFGYWNIIMRCDWSCEPAPESDA